LISGTADGKLIFFNTKGESTRSLKICSGAIHAMRFCPFNDTIYASDGNHGIILVNKQTFTKGETIKFSSVVKAIHINNNGNYLVGLKNGIDNNINK